MTRQVLRWDRAKLRARQSTLSLSVLAPRSILPERIPDPLYKLVHITEHTHVVKTISSTVTLPRVRFLES